MGRMFAHSGAAGFWIEMGLQRFTHQRWQLLF
jgi:hypothetical protein